MNSFDGELSRRLADIREKGLYRELRRVDSPQSPHIVINGRKLLNFSSNDYLGLANHPALKEVAIDAIKRFGVGAGSSRLICGSLALFHGLEVALAIFKNTAAAISFSSGYAAALGTITSLVGKDDVIIVDKLVHACIVDAAKLSSAKLRVFAHNDLNDLEDKLKWADAQPRHTSHVTRRILIVTESVFSMDGDHAPLKEIVALKEKYGAWLMVDEAHATGLYGANRRGLAEELGVSDRIEIQMGTMGKALGASGGYICGSRALIDYLVNRARSFIFSTAPVPPAAGAAIEGINLVQSDEGRRLSHKLWDNVEAFRLKLKTQNSQPHGAIIPIIIGDEEKAVHASTQLREQNIFVPAIRYPTVARGEARLRITLTASHSADEITTLTDALKQVLNGKS